MDKHAATVARYDAVVVGTGFAGMYMLHRLRERGLTVRAFEAGDDVGGTWYWNRYPGARCDVESVEYQYGFSEELVKGWSWSERYACQPEIMRYADYVAKTLDLRRDIKFKTRVTAATYDEDAKSWTVETDQGDRVTAPFCIMATGCLSASRVPEIAGRDSFKGRPFLRCRDWPQRLRAMGVGKVVPITAENEARLADIKRLAENDFELVSAIHPSALILDQARLEPGVWVSAGAIIGYKAEIRTGSMVNTGVKLDHHSIMEGLAGNYRP